jgi:serine protease Do
MIDDVRSQPPRRRWAVPRSPAAALAVAALAAGVGEFGWLSFAAPQAYAAGDHWRGPASFAPLVDRIKGAVVSVHVKSTRSAGAAEQVLPVPRGSPFRRFFEQPNPDEVVTGEGSGFFISPDGYIVTNNHVAGYAKTVEVTTADGDIHAAKVVGTDERSDLALIKIDADRQFPHVKFADRPPQVGDWVVAVGNPFGLGGTVTAGIVSARARDIATNPYDASYLQIDAPINKGNSGGPAFDLDGNVVGVNTAIYSPSGGSVGIGFDVPADTARSVVDQLKQKGYVTRGWLGVEVQPVTAAIADSLGMTKAEGALVDQSQTGSPAEKAGIKAGDVVLAINGQPVKDSRALAEKISAASPGDQAQLTVLRDGENRTLGVTLLQMPNQREQADVEGEQQQEQQQQDQPTGEPPLGLSMAPAKDVEGSGDEGVVVLNVDPSGPAAQDGVQSGDVILDAGGETVRSPRDVRQAIDRSRSRGRHSILMRVKTAVGTRFVALPTG